MEENHRRPWLTFAAAALSACSSVASTPPVPRQDLRPNVVIAYADDLGWGDLGCQGGGGDAMGFATPNLDRLAAEGTRFTDAYVPQPVCTPSRAALLTGCYPMRLGLGYRVLFPYSETALALEEVTLAESLSSVGYATACIGKWHLGHQPAFLPTRQGFDEFFGIPYSNDMDGYHYRKIDFTAPPLPLYRGEQVIEESPDQMLFTRRLTDEAIDFVRRHRERPFFLYLPHIMPHKPIHASREFIGRSELGLYGDVIEELDDSLGRLLKVLEELDLEERTIVVFASDNGPWRAASSGPLRGKKAFTWEGGVRIPMIVRWPGRVPAGRVCGAMVSVLDIKPTIDGLCGVPRDGRGGRVIDGVDLGPLLLGGGEGEPETPPPPHEALAFYREERLEAVRSGRWKLHVHREEWKGEDRGPLLFDLVDDLGETENLATEHPEVVERLLRIAERFRTELGDAATGRVGSGVRPVGRAMEAGAGR